MLEGSIGRLYLALHQIGYRVFIYRAKIGPRGFYQRLSAVRDAQRAIGHDADPGQLHPGCGRFLKESGLRLRPATQHDAGLCLAKQEGIRSDTGFAAKIDVCPEVIGV